MKVCTKCKIEKEKSLFALNRNICKDCIKKIAYLYKINNKERI